MNKVAANSLAAIVLMIVVFFVGRLFFLSSLQTELQQASQLLEENQRKYAALEIEVSKIKPESPEEMAGRKRPAVKAGLSGLVKKPPAAPDKRKGRRQL